MVEQVGWEGYVKNNPDPLYGKNIHVREVSPSYDKAVAQLVEALNDTLNYLHWHCDDLTGDDCIGDQKLTQSYNRKVTAINKALEAFELANKGKV